MTTTNSNAQSPIEHLEVGEDPTTCTKCGSRTDLIDQTASDGSRIERCLHCAQLFRVTDEDGTESAEEREAWEKGLPICLTLTRKDLGRAYQKTPGAWVRIDHFAFGLDDVRRAAKVVFRDEVGRGWTLKRPSFPVGMRDVQRPRMSSMEDFQRYLFSL